MDTGLPCIIVTHLGNKTGAIRKIPLMRVKVGNGYVLVGSMLGAPKNPVWVYNLRANAEVEIRDGTEVHKMRVREVPDDPERGRLWSASVVAYPPYSDYQARTTRKIPVFLAEPVWSDPKNSPNVSQRWLSPSICASYTITSPRVHRLSREWRH